MDMNPTIPIIKYIIYNKDNYNTYYKDININKEQKELYNIYITIPKLFGKFGSIDSFSVDDLEIFFYDQYPVLKSSEREMYASIFEQIRSSEVSSEIASQSLAESKKRATASKLADVSFAISQGKASVEDLADILEDLRQTENYEKQTPENGLENQFVTDDLEELYNETIATPGLRWRLKALNESLGSIRKGDFGFVFARPETGKTTWLASEITFMASQTDKPILWINNEETGTKVMTRCYQAALGLTLTELYSNRESAKEKYKELTGNRIKLYDSAATSKTDVERLCKELNPSLVVFDQIDKIKGFDNDREDLRLGSIYTWARELAKDYCPVIGICQADGQGEGVKWLTMGHVSNAKTAKQSEADWILGIGKSNDDGMEYIRCLHLSKNKLTGDSDTIPELRHGKMQVLIEPTSARYRDL